MPLHQRYLTLLAWKRFDICLLRKIHAPFRILVPLAALILNFKLKKATGKVNSVIVFVLTILVIFINLGLITQINKYNTYSWLLKKTSYHKIGLIVTLSLLVTLDIGMK